MLHGMEGSTAVTSSLFHHKDSTVKVQRRLEPEHRYEHQMGSEEPPSMERHKKPCPREPTENYPAVTIYQLLYALL